MPGAPWSIWRAISTGTLVVGTIDLVDAFVFFGFFVPRGTTPARILQSIASGALGRAAYRGGLPAAALGLLIHYFVAFGIVATFVLLSRAAPLLARRPLVYGPLYGVGAYVFMNLVVIPLSAIGPQRLGGAPLVNGILIHAFGIGLPAALFAARASSRP